MIAGGDQLFMLRPGAQTMAFRDPPLDIGRILVAAAEARPPWRYAVASEELVALFFKGPKEDGLVRLRPEEPGIAPTHIAWARGEGNAGVLYVRWEDGAVVRTKPDMTGVDVLELPPIDALASDGNGNLALACFADDRCRVYLARDAAHLDFNEFDFPADPDGQMRLAVADKAVALAVDDGGVFVSRAAGAPFLPCEPLAKAGAFEFEGATSDSALFGAIQTATMGSIIRVDREGTAIRIAEFDSEGGPVPEITALSWDASRHKLWGASPEMGLIECTAPSAKRGKKAALS
jgi:hypothetical protein